MNYTTENITELYENEIFVFGSNEAGRHGAGAAKSALRWGAIYGQGYGHHGNTYAIPTKDRYIKTLPLSTIQRYVDAFKQYSAMKPELRFLVTEIGCGLAGYSPKDVAPMFQGYTNNVVLPKSFSYYL